MSFGSRARAAMDAYGPACVGIDPHTALLEDWGLPDSVEGLERFAATCVEAFAGPRRVRQAAVRLLRALRRTRCSRARADDPGPAAHRHPRGARRETWRHRQHRGRVRRGVPRRGQPDVRRRRHGQPVPRLRLARAVLRGRRAARRRRLRAGAHVESGGPGGPAGGQWTPSPWPAASWPSSRRSTAIRRRWAPFGAVVGATIGSTEEDLAINGPLLAPGLGAQGGTVDDVVRLFGSVGRSRASVHVTGGFGRRTRCPGTPRFCCSGQCRTCTLAADAPYVQESSMMRAVTGVITTARRVHPR